MMHRGISALGTLACAQPGGSSLGRSGDRRSGGGSARAAGSTAAAGSGRRGLSAAGAQRRVLQAQAAELAASRDTRPEVRAFARRMVEFRREQIASLLSAAHERTLAVSPVPALEHKVILENLEPLDSLELSRRYSEVQVQALEQEMAAYAQAESSPDGWVATVARDSKARLQGLLDEARQVRHAIGR